MQCVQPPRAQQGLSLHLSYVALSFMPVLKLGIIRHIKSMALVASDCKVHVTLETVFYTFPHEWCSLCHFSSTDFDMHGSQEINAWIQDSDCPLYLGKFEELTLWCCADTHRSRKQSIKLKRI